MGFFCSTAGWVPPIEIKWCKAAYKWSWKHLWEFFARSIWTSQRWNWQLLYIGYLTSIPIIPKSIISPATWRRWLRRAPYVLLRTTFQSNTCFFGTSLRWWANHDKPQGTHSFCCIPWHSRNVNSIIFATFKRNFSPIWRKTTLSTFSETSQRPQSERRLF